MKRLSQPTGEVADNSPQDSDTDESIVRPAILVHAGAEGAPITFMSGDGEIKFDTDRIKKIVEVHNLALKKLALEYGGDDKIPMGAYAPILDQHESDSNNRIVGRLTGPLTFEVRDVPKVGKNVPCAIAKPGITFLGKETVQRVKDGRIYHLSIGINEEDDSLGETSTVIEPAAPGAMLLKKGDKKPVKRGERKMSAQMKRMQAHASRMAKLAAIQSEMKGMSAKLVTSKGAVKLAKKKSEVTHRLTGLMRSGKLTPAEYKKMDLTKLAALDDTSLSTVLGTFEALEPKVDPTQRGSTAAVDFTTMGRDLEKKQLKRLRGEIAGDFKRLTGKKMSFGEEDKDHGDTHEMAGGNKEESVSPGKDPHAVEGEGGDEKQLAALKACHMAIGEHLAAGDVEKAKEAHAEMSKHMGAAKHLEIGDVKSEDQQKSMSSMEAQVDELTTQMGRLAGMVDELMGVEKEEGHDLEAGEESEAKEPKESEAE